MKLYVLLFSLFCLTGFAFAQDKLPPRVVRVVGTGEVKVVPDRAVVDLGVEKQDPNAAAAKAAADRAARQILAALRSNGIDDKDMQTTYLALRPESYTRKGVRISYFVAEETLSIIVRDLSKIDALLDALVRAGGNRIDSVSYETSDLRKYRDQARDLAAKAAREKATALAQALGQDVGKAYSIDEVADYGYSALANSTLSYYREKEKASGPSLAPGQKTISASVTVSFDLN